VFGVFVNGHAVEFFGAVVFADTLHECGGLLFFAFGLFGGDLLRHREQYRVASGGQIRGRGMSGEVDGEFERRANSEKCCLSIISTASDQDVDMDRNLDRAGAAIFWFWSAMRKEGANMEPFLGQIQLFPYDFAPVGWVPCAGQILPIIQNAALFALIGTKFGGNGTTTFQLPKLDGPAVSVGYYIALVGIFPSRA